MVNYHLMDTYENIKFINNYYYIFSRDKYIFLPNETKDISIYLIFYIKNDKLLHINIDDRLASIFNLSNYFYTNNNKITLTLNFINKTNKTIIINKDEKFIKFIEIPKTDFNIYNNNVNKNKNKNINDLINESNIELKNNNLLFYD